MERVKHIRESHAARWPLRKSPCLFSPPERDRLQIVAPFHESVKRSLLAGHDEPKGSKTPYRPDVHIQIGKLTLGRCEKLDLAKQLRQLNWFLKYM